VAQFIAGVWAYRTRDGLGTGMHGIWGAFWMAFGLDQLLVATGTLPAATGPQNVPFGFWFIALAAITLVGALGALANSLGLLAVLATLTGGSAFAAAGYISGVSWAQTTAGWLFVIAAAAAWYMASALMFKSSFGRTILPTGELAAAADVPGRRSTAPIQYASGMPGEQGRPVTAGPGSPRVLCGAPSRGHWGSRTTDRAGKAVGNEPARGRHLSPHGAEGTMPLIGCEPPVGIEPTTFSLRALTESHQISPPCHRARPFS
jgi:GPR1/FUN34/yaaH family